MRSLKTLALAAAAMAMFASHITSAADLPRPILPPPPVEEYGGWYLRGDIGMTNQRVRSLDNVLFAATPGLTIVDKNFESGVLFGIGIGYRYNNWLRFDLTGEYRGEVGFHGLDLWNDGVNARFNNYTGKKSEWLMLLNAYLDLGTWKSVTPFIGAGIGWSRNTFHSFRDMGIDGAGQPTLAYAAANTVSNFAWALHAGLAYEVTPHFTVELAYRYVHLGNAMTGDIIAFDGTNAVFNPMHFNGIHSHDVKLGVRWMMADMGVPHWQPPIVRKY